jgi:phosphatidylinositol glycan class B
MATKPPRTPGSGSPQPTAAASAHRKGLSFSLHSTIVLFILSFRLLNALTIRTFFQPDEYFQSLEPAWKIAFGDGWITWVFCG